VRVCPQCGTRYADNIAFCPADGTPTDVAAAPASPVDRLIGVTIDRRYRIDARIGEGGMGVVYRATHVALNKPFAIKVMRGEQANDPEIVQRFVQEARAVSEIGHPNIVNISDFGRTADGAVYFAMEFLHGRTLAEQMLLGPLSRERALPIFIQISGALEAAHQHDIVHRDLKPDNVYLTREAEHHDFVKVLDFGIAKVKNAAAKLTRTGMVFGTPHYMSPEQAAGQSVDHRSDIYSLGVIMFQVFAGQLPFDAESFMGVMTKHMFEPVPSPSSVSGAVQGPIEDILIKALQKKPEQRYQSMRELQAELERVQSGRPLLHSALPTRPEPTEPRLLTSPTLAAAAADAVVRDDDEVIALPKRRPSLWVWLLVGVVALGFGVLSLRPFAPAAPVRAAGGGFPQPSAAEASASAQDRAPVPQPSAAEGAPAQDRTAVPQPSAAEGAPAQDRKNRAAQLAEPELEPAAPEPQPSVSPQRPAPHPQPSAAETKPPPLVRKRRPDTQPQPTPASNKPKPARAPEQSEIVDPWH
jgi:tRNA A-37 threonylcarbamoyl transferase component Bud32